MFITKSNEFIIHPVLQNLAIAYPLTGLVAHLLAPLIDVEEGAEEGYYFKFDKTNIQSGFSDIRAYGARATSYEWKLSKDSYSCIEHSIEKGIDWRELKKWAKYMDIAKVTQEITLELLLLNYEIRVATLLTTEANYSSSSYYNALTSTSKWSDFVNSDPEDDVETGREVVALGAAEPNTIAIPIHVWRTARRHPAIRALILEENNKQLTEDGFPTRLFGLNAVYPGARKVSTMPGVSETIARVWGNNVWIGVVNPRPSMRTMSFSYTIRSDGIKSEVYEDKPCKSDVIRIQHQVSDEAVVCDTAGYLLETVIA